MNGTEIIAKNMYVSQIANNKKQHLELLLLADEQESMIN